MLEMGARRRDQPAWVGAGETTKAINAMQRSTLYCTLPSSSRHRIFSIEEYLYAALNTKVARLLIVDGIVL